MKAVSGEHFCTDELQCTLCTRHVEKGKRIAVTIVSQPPHRTNHLLLFSTTNRKKDLRRVPAALAAAFSLATTDPEPTTPDEFRTTRDQFKTGGTPSASTYPRVSGAASRRSLGSRIVACTRTTPPSPRADVEAYCCISPLLSHAGQASAGTVHPDCHRYKPFPCQR